MKMCVQDGGSTFTATLENNAAAEALAEISFCIFSDSFCFFFRFHILGKCSFAEGNRRLCLPVVIASAGRKKIAFASERRIICGLFRSVIAAECFQAIQFQEQQLIRIHKESHFSWQSFQLLCLHGRKLPVVAVEAVDMQVNHELRLPYTA